MAYLTQVGTSTLSNQNISSALLVHTYTNTTRIRKLYVNVFVDQVAGNGAYLAYITIQRAGAGSAYESIRTVKDAASGITAIAFLSMPVILNSTDVLKVYVIGLAGDTTTPDIITDVNEELADLATLPTTAAIRDAVQAGLYEEGSVWIDTTLAPTSGTTPYVDGTQHNPVSNIADATTIAAAVGLKRFRLAIGSVVTLAQGYTGYQFWGRTWTLILNAQTVTNCYFEGAIVVGTSVGAGQKFNLCAFGTVTLPPCSISASVFIGPITLSGSGAYYLDHCQSGNPADTTPPVVDFTVTVSQDNDFNVFHHSGGLEFANMGQSGTDTANINGNGRVIFASTCVTPAVARLRGNFNQENNGTLTVIDDANYERDTHINAHYDEQTSEARASGSYGQLTKDNLDAAVGSRMPTTHIDATAGKVDGVALVDVTTLNSDMRGTDNAALATGVQLSTQGKADVNAEVVDALNVDSYAEPPQANPPRRKSVISLKAGEMTKRTTVR
jgi:hypothetical protein